MAGTFTHWMVVEEALDRFHALPQRHRYFPIILGNHHFVLLGAVGPDYPYLKDLANNFLKLHSWADRMHYENTGELLKYGVQRLAELDGEAFDTCLAWLSGFVTHLVADSIVHPGVNATVGPYLFNSGEHRHCEMTQDAFIFKEVKNVELTYGASEDEGFIRIVRMCSDPEDEHRINRHVRDFWTRALEAAHPGGKDKFPDIDPDDWHKHFLQMIKQASDPIALFRHIGEGANLVYKKTSDLTPDERERFIDRMKLPGDRTGSFKDVFDKVVETVIETWRKLFVDIESKTSENCMAYVKNWNLDTGVDEDRPYFW